MLKHLSFAAIAVSILIFSVGCGSLPASPEQPVKFERLFCWGSPDNDQNAKRYAAAGVTDILVRNRKQYELARKYGMTPYWKWFSPAGPHFQVMTPAEQQHYDYINGKDLPRTISRSERRKILHRRRIEKQHRYGGAAVTAVDTLNDTRIRCFISDDNLLLSQRKIDRLLADAPEGTAGIFMDYVGYMNHHGCFCKNCLQKYQTFLKEQNLADTPANRTRFYRKKLVEYYNRVIDYIKSRRPDYKIVVHIYPDFRNDPLYGNLIKADYCGQTVAWYFKWEQEKIANYTSIVTNTANEHFAHVAGVPFLGINTNPASSLGSKTPQELEQELRTILGAGGRTLMVCSGKAILEPGFYEVFMKYCAKE